MKISLCIPVYNEEASVGKCFDSLCTFAKDSMDKHGAEFEIIFCDDGSTDNTKQILDTFRNRKLPEGVSVIVTGYPDNRGKGSAVREAVTVSGGDAVIYTDCDLAYGLVPVMSACRRISEGADVVLGSRALARDGYGEYTFIRRLASKMYLRFVSILAGFKFSDSQCGFKAFSGEAARKIFSLCRANGFSFDLEAILLAVKAGYKVEEMPVKILNHGASKIHVVSDSLKMMRDVVKIRKRVRRTDVTKITKSFS